MKIDGGRDGFQVVTLDVGTSSARSMLFDGDACVVDGFGTQLPYEVSTTADGGVEVDADVLAELVFKALDAIQAQVAAAGLRPAAVGCCTFWHNILGVGADDRPTTPVIHLFDTRSAAAARELGEKMDGRAAHARTGCVLHPSYVPAKLLWLSQSAPEAFRAARRWMSFGEYLFLKLFGKAVASTSMVSGSGLWNQNENRYDPEMLRVLPISGDQLSPVAEMDEPATGLRDEYRRRWPSFANLPWFPALGDGACNNIGSGCVSRDRFALMVGTSGAMRAVAEQPGIEIPPGLWCYRVDRARFVLGGALSNGGDVFAWMRRTLVLPSAEEIESQLAELAPGAHGLTVLPLFAGERSTRWRADARAAITGLSFHTQPIEILRAALEAVALRFRGIYDLMTQAFGVPAQVVASGAALAHSPAWTQMMADALGHPLVMCLEKEATSRGVALLTLERLGGVKDPSDRPARLGQMFEPKPEHRPAYEEQLKRQRRLYDKLFEEPW